MITRVLTPEEIREGLINSLKDVHDFLDGFNAEDCKVHQKREIMTFLWKRESEILKDIMGVEDYMISGKQEEAAYIFKRKN
jgi:hypothetical protein